MIVSKDEVDNYFKTDFLPYVTSFYHLTTKTNTSIADVLQLVHQSIQMLNTDETKVFMHFSTGKLADSFLISCNLRYSLYSRLMNGCETT